MIVKVMRWLLAAPFYASAFFFLHILLFSKEYLIRGGFADQEKGALTGISMTLLGMGMLLYVPYFVGGRHMAWKMTAGGCIALGIIMAGISYAQFRGL
jgi:hypothetical protein